MSVVPQNTGNPYTGVQPSNGATTVTASVTVAAGAHQYMLILVQGEGNGVQNDTLVSQVSVNGNTGLATQLAQESSPSWGWTEAWSVIAPPQGTYNVIITTNIGDSKTLQVYVFDEVDQSTPATASVGNSSSATISSTTLLLAEAGDYCMDSVNLDGILHLPAASGSGTAYSVENTGHTGCSQGFTAAGGGGDVVEWTWSNACALAYLGIRVLQYVTPPQQLRPDAA